MNIKSVFIIYHYQIVYPFHKSTSPLPMRITILLLFLASFAQPAEGQTLVKAIFAEYGYPNISKDSVMQYYMFGITRYRLYADEKFFQVESFQHLSEEEAKQIGPTMRSMMVQERATNKTYLCISFDTLRIRMDGGDKGRESLQRMNEAYQVGSEHVYGKGRQTLDIQGHTCQEIFTMGGFSDTISAFVAPNIGFDPALMTFPLYVRSEVPGVSGLLLGRNEVLPEGGTIEFRALKLTLNEPKDVQAELATYRLVSEEQGEEEMKAFFSKMMGMPAGDGKN